MELFPFLTHQESGIEAIMKADNMNFDEALSRSESCRELPGASRSLRDLEQIETFWNGEITSIKGLGKFIRDHSAEVDQEIHRSVNRSQIMFLFSAFDTFLHEMVKYVYMLIWDGTLEENNRFFELAIPMRMFKEGESSSFSKQWRINLLDSFFKSKTLCQAKTIGNVLQMMGIRDTDKKQLYIDCFHMNENESKSRFDKTVQKLDSRRNSIAHESDRDIKSFERKPITDDEVLELIDDIDAIAINIIKNVRTNLNKEISACD